MIHLLSLAPRSQDLRPRRTAQGVHRRMAQTAIKGGGRSQETEGETSQAKGTTLFFF